MVAADKQWKVGILYPGEMGVSFAQLLKAQNYLVYASLNGRSSRTREFAKNAKLELTANDEELIETCDIILSILRPDKSYETALHFANLTKSKKSYNLRCFVDFNAIAPRTVMNIHEAFKGTQVDVVDGKTWTCYNGAPIH